MYRKREVDPNCGEWLNQLPTISVEQKNKLDKPFTMNEVSNVVLKSMHQGKSPGNDGLTLGIYTLAWKFIKKPLLKSLQESVKIGELSAPQKQSVIRLIEKKDKDPALIKNWRPISLLNVDAKILAKLLADRLKSVLGDLIGPEQNAYVEGRNIHDGIRLIEQVIEYAEKRKDKAAILAIDFKKAFDSISHEYLWRVLEKMGFGPHLIHMIQTLYRNPESAIINNGKTSKYFKLGRACRQGDPIAPYLFIIALEPLVLKIKSTLKGYTLPGGDAKESALADDLTCFPINEKEVKELFKIIQKFTEVSGLEVNRDKSEMLLIGEWNMEEIKSLGFEFVDTLKITGVHFGKNEHKSKVDKLNFDTMISKMENNFQKWKCRILSVLGRITVAKSQGLGTLQFLANAIVIPEDYKKKASKPIYSFAWNGPIPKIRKLKAAKKWEEGGVKMPIVEDLIAAASMHWFKRAESSDAIWAKTIKYELTHLGGFEAANNNIDLNHEDNYILSEHTKYILMNWISLSMAKENYTAHNKSLIWYNKLFMANILHKKKFKKSTLSPIPLFRKLGIKYLEDFFDCDGRIIQAEEAIRRGLPKKARYEWERIARAIKNSKADISLVRGKYRRFDLTNLENDQIEQVTFRIGDTVLSGHQITQSKVLSLIATKRDAGINNFEKKVIERFDFSKEDWKKVYSQVKKHSIATYKRSFLIKFFNKAVGTNIDFIRVGHTKTTKCSYCNEEKQDYYHLFWDCKAVAEFRDAISCKWILEKPLTSINWCFGLFEDNTPRNNAISFITLEANEYIYRSNWSKEQLSLSKFKSCLYSYERVEYQIALDCNKMEKHLSKWENIKELI